MDSSQTKVTEDVVSNPNDNTVVQHVVKDGVEAWIVSDFNTVRSFCDESANR